MKNNELEFSEQLESHNALVEFEEKYGISSNRTIKVDDCIYDSIDVVVSHSGYGNSDLWKLEILWPDDVDEYKVYSSQYCHIEFIGNTLIIYNNSKTIIVY